MFQDSPVLLTTSCPDQRGCSFLWEPDCSEWDWELAVLVQEFPVGTKPPISYGSRYLQKHEKNYQINELGTFGVV